MKIQILDALAEASKVTTPQTAKVIF